jgi:glutamate--cysteine ligase
MSNPGDGDATPITSIRQLADYIAVGCKPRAQFRIGTEHEKFGFRLDDLAPPPYAPADGQPGCIRDLLDGLRRFGATPILDGVNAIGLKQGGASVSLEPAGQLELSGAPLETLHETKAEFDSHFAQVRAVSEGLRLGFAPLGFHPTATRAAMPWMPKGRYAIMRRYMPIVGTLGLDMMTRTCTVQVNLDYESERDMVRKLRVSLLLQPLATALFANSPFTEGRPNGFQSYRAHVWTDTDNQRSGIPRVMFEDGFGFERYAAWLVDSVPMYFVYRDGGYIDLAGRSFRDFMAGRLEELPGQCPSLKDWGDHVTTVFPEVRLKQYLEMRGADVGPLDMGCALQALWVGVLYDDAALAAAWDLCKDWTSGDREQLRRDAARTGLKGKVAGRKIQDVAKDLVRISAEGLRARGVMNEAGQDERRFLGPLFAIADSGLTQADRLLEKYHGEWRGDINSAFKEQRY